nr:MAG TPA: hypothetical protein [Crassvirales sp.]
MSRKEIYAKVKELNLQEEIKKKYGDNYTRVSNTELEAIIANHIAKTSTPGRVNSCGRDYKLDRLIEVLKKKHILLYSEVAYINS